MSLLDYKWLPVRRSATSERDWITPAQLSDPDIAAFDAPRPDFNGALLQFAIGLLQTTTPVDTSREWAERFREPPDEEELQRWFDSVAPALDLDGDAARFMQDRTLTMDDGAVNEIAALLIEAPGGKTLRDNGDHFIKRGQVAGMCPHCVATALLTLQINAPSGGAGHRTGLRGGGPLTTLVVCQPTRSLWHDLWVNVQERSRFLEAGGDPEKTEPCHTFPWMSEQTRLQKEGGALAPVDAHPAHVFWAMPRRIRLDFGAVEAGTCDICGRPSEQLVTRYVTKNYGLNYKGPWDHPLSPYYENKEEWLPMHPQPGGFGYRHWLAWVLGTEDEKKRQRAARIVSAQLDSGRIRALGHAPLHLRAFGFDMDNMKARCWYDSTLPLYGLAECEAGARRRVQNEVALWLAGADLAAYYLRSAVKGAWFGHEARGDLSVVDAGFWAATEPSFYEILQAYIAAERQEKEIDSLVLKQRFHAALARTALALFDGCFAGAGAVERQHPQRVATAYRQLRQKLYGRKLHEALALPKQEVEPGKAQHPNHETASA
ncbi:type I-E CRISPR-associated protein Cse1/CasA [Algiphilus sp.]|uniref:type I-E CRISPR-associated protein Cse1/CasA n=1 Tax=Algiphilus sp. TaxID=1872431 RepID=UPI0025BB62FA|nr:type I-E CRISPR-associated protein Cse1/CasA [Algiphilus sp.]MCK5771744.1 type I-E CRISPR-associated protein Cse1/CasA [Algiphilus sp.]